MSAPEVADPCPAAGPAEPAILRLARHAIGLWHAAEEIGDARLLDALRPLVERVGQALAVDLMDGRVEDGAKH